VNSDTSADKSPVRTLFWRGTKETREPCERRGDAATIDKRDNQFILGAFNIDSVGYGFTGQSAHPKQ
jgi:hypothetical protein